jgi:hypothetical protein
MDGDVVSNGFTTVLVRQAGEWYQVSAFGTTKTNDFTVMQEIAAGRLQVERKRVPLTFRNAA